MIAEQNSSQNLQESLKGIIASEPSSPAEIPQNDNLNSVEQKFVATVGKRLSNHILDTIFMLIFLFIFEMILSLSGMDFSLPRGFGIIFMLVYYILFEGIFQKTPAKYITKTKVVMKDGSKPSIGGIAVRSFSRFIPFEFFSFLTRKYPIGWHDSISETIVVPEEYTAEDIKKVNFNNKDKSKMWIIVLVIVLFIFMLIGLLSTFAVVALNNARAKTRDAFRVSHMKQIQIALEMYYADVGSYPAKSEMVFGTGKIAAGGTNYMDVIPDNPSPRDDGSCANSSYIYEQNSPASYTITYCLGGDSGNISAGIHHATPNSIANP